MESNHLTVLHGGFLSLRGVTLGRLVTNLPTPDQDFWPLVPSQIDGDEIDERPFLELRALLGGSTRVGLHAKITQFIYGNISAEEMAAAELVASKAKVYAHRQPRLYFQHVWRWCYYEVDGERIKASSDLPSGWIVYGYRGVCDSCPNVGSSWKRLLICNGHDSHVSAEFVRYCIDNNIVILLIRLMLCNLLMLEYSVL